MNVTKILAVACVAAFVAMSYSIISHDTDYTKDLPEYRMYAEKMFSGCPYKMIKTGPDIE